MSLSISGMVPLLRARCPLFDTCRCAAIKLWWSLWHLRLGDIVLVVMHWRMCNFERRYSWQSNRGCVMSGVGDRADILMPVVEGLSYYTVRLAECLALHTPYGDQSLFSAIDTPFTLSRKGCLEMDMAKSRAPFKASAELRNC